MAIYYAQPASADLIIAEATTPNAVGRAYPNISATCSESQVAGWRPVTDAVHSAGGRRARGCRVSARRLPRPGTVPASGQWCWPAVGSGPV